MRPIFKRLSALLLCLCLAGFICPALSEDTAPVHIRVAYYPLEGFFEYNANGAECGYGVDYLNELKKHANIEWEYVPVDSWEDIGPMMRSGEVDVRMPVSEPSTPSETYNYTTEPILSSYHAILTLQSREDLYYQDYAVISTLRIAVVDGLLDKTGLSDYLDSIGVTKNLVYFEDYNSCLAALRSGEVDGLISNIMDLTDELKILDKFYVVKNYITTLKGSPYYAMINSAMTQLALDNPSFQSNLYEEYYPERSNEPFTRAESEYLAQVGELTVAVRPDRQPVSYYDEDTGRYRGIAIDIADLVAERLGVHFNYVPITTDTPLEMLETADLVMPLARSNDLDRYFATSTLFESEILLAVRDGTEAPDGEARVGVLKSTTGIAAVLSELGSFELVTFSDNASALRALQGGKIDVFANASYVLNWLLENPRYSNLHTLYYRHIPLAYAISGRMENTALRSALDKAILAVTDDERSQLILTNTAFSVNDLSTADKLYVYRGELISAGVMLLMLILAALFYNHTRTEYITEIRRRGMEQEKANRAKSEFLSRMSHDMRTPMNGILGLAALMRDEDDPAALKRDLAQLEMSGQYLLQLINDTLDMSKIESGKLELRLAPMDGEMVFGNIMSNAMQLARDKGVQLNLHTPEIAPGKWVPVMADASRLEQIIMNVLSNAIKFTPTGGHVDLIMETVSVTPEQVTDRYIIRDSGIGISPEFLPHIFEPFSQEGRAGTDHRNGTGLGMPIVKQLVDLTGGEISIKSVLNEGTEVTLLMRYPVCSPDQAAAHTGAQAADYSALRGMRVLLCEDHPLNAQIAVRLLEKQGVAVDVAGDGQQGLTRFSSSAPGHYAAILMDVRMPVMNGLEATRAIRALPRPDAAAIPIIAMTANAYDDDVRQCAEAGMNAHISKPVNPETLYATLAGQRPALHELPR